MNTNLTTEQKSAAMKAIAEAAQPHCPEGYGMMLILAPVGPLITNGGDFASNLRKEDCVKLLRDTASRLEKRLAASQ